MIKLFYHLDDITNYNTPYLLLYQIPSPKYGGGYGPISEVYISNLSWRKKVSSHNIPYDLFVFAPTYTRYIFLPELEAYKHNHNQVQKSWHQHTVILKEKHLLIRIVQSFVSWLIDKPPFLDGLSSKDLANRWTDMVPSYNEASYRTWEGFKLFIGRVSSPPSSPPKNIFFLFWNSNLKWDEVDFPPSYLKCP